jgi:hypothetical protein
MEHHVEQGRFKWYAFARDLLGDWLSHKFQPIPIFKKNRFMQSVNLSFVCTLCSMAMLSYQDNEGNYCSYIQVGFIKLGMFFNIITPWYIDCGQWPHGTLIPSSKLKFKWLSSYYLVNLTLFSSNKHYFKLSFFPKTIYLYLQKKVWTKLGIERGVKHWIPNFI